METELSHKSSYSEKKSANSEVLLEIASAWALFPKGKLGLFFTWVGNVMSDKALITCNVKDNEVTTGDAG